jgi:hypothetical protein
MESVLVYDSIPLCSFDIMIAPIYPFVFKIFDISLLPFLYRIFSYFLLVAKEVRVLPVWAKS